MFETILFDRDLESAVDAMVRSCFYSADEIVEFFHEIAVDDPGAGLVAESIEHQVLTLVERSQAALAEVMQQWPDQTDNDKLAEAFREMNEAGVWAIEKFGAMASDAGELYGQIRGDNRWRGYCFYHSQDLVRAVQGEDLMLRYAAAVDRPTDQQNLEIGKEISEVLAKHGLRVEWEGDPKKTITIQLDWRRRPNQLDQVEPLPPPPYIKPWWKFW